MSTYEALVNVHSQLETEFKELSARAKASNEIGELIHDLVDHGAVDLEPRYVHRLVVGRRRLFEIGPMIRSALDDADGYLQGACHASFVSETADAVGDQALSAQAGKQEEERRLKAEGEIDGAKALVHTMRRVLADSEIPKLAVK